MGRILFLHVFAQAFGRASRECMERKMRSLFMYRARCPSMNRMSAREILSATYSHIECADGFRWRDACTAFMMYGQKKKSVHCGQPVLWGGRT